MATPRSSALRACDASDARATTTSGKRLVVAILVFVAATLAVYPLVRHHVMEERAKERAEERAREAMQRATTPR